jgi:hypothetical protein
LGCRATLSRRLSIHHIAVGKTAEKDEHGTANENGNAERCRWLSTRGRRAEDGDELVGLHGGGQFQQPFGNVAVGRLAISQGHPSAAAWGRKLLSFRIPIPVRCSVFVLFRRLFPHRQQM